MIRDLVIKTTLLLALILFLASFLFKIAEASETVTASWYDSNSVQKEGTCHAEKCYTASGKEIHALEKAGVLFAASNSFKLGTRVRVRDPRSGRTVIVKILDRGGFAKYGRGLDLCKRAFTILENPRRGLLQVEYEPL